MHTHIHTAGIMTGASELAFSKKKKKKKEEEEKKELASYLTSLCHDSISYLALTISSMSFFRGGV